MRCNTVKWLLFTRRLDLRRIHAVPALRLIVRMLLVLLALQYFTWTLMIQRRLCTSVRWLRSGVANGARTSSSTWWVKVLQIGRYSLPHLRGQNLVYWSLLSATSQRSKFCRLVFTLCHISRVKKFTGWALLSTTSNWSKINRNVRLPILRWETFLEYSVVLFLVWFAWLMWILGGCSFIGDWIRVCVIKLILAWFAFWFEIHAYPKALVNYRCCERAI